MRVTGRLLPAVLSVVVSALLLAGCQSTAAEDLESELEGIPGVESAYVGSERVKATLADDVTAADALTAIQAVRDASVAGHPSGDQVELVVVIRAGERDFGGAQPWMVYSYGSWASGTLSGDAFAQQAAFFAGLADWETLATTPAQILRVAFTVDPAPVAEGAADGETDAADPAATETPAPPAEVVGVHLDQPYPNPNATTDVDALTAELAAMWTTSGGAAEGLTIR